MLLGLFPAQRGDAASLPTASPVPAVLDLAEFDRLRSQTNCLVVDVRTPGEFASGHVPGALNIDWNSTDFEAKAGQLDKGRTLLVYCASGNRSARAIKHLRELGYYNLGEFKGGWNVWKRARKPVE